MKYTMKIMLIETFCLFDKSDKYFLLIQSQLHHETITEMNHSMCGACIWGLFDTPLANEKEEEMLFVHIPYRPEFFSGPIFSYLFQ